MCHELERHCPTVGRDTVGALVVTSVEGAVLRACDWIWAKPLVPAGRITGPLGMRIGWKCGRVSVTVIVQLQTKCAYDCHMSDEQLTYLICGQLRVIGQDTFSPRGRIRQIIISYPIVRMNEETIKNNKGPQWLHVPFVTGVTVLRLSHFVRPHPVAVERDRCLLRLAFSRCGAYLHSKVG